MAARKKGEREEAARVLMRRAWDHYDNREYALAKAALDAVRDAVRAAWPARWAQVMLAGDVAQLRAMLIRNAPWV